MTFGRFRLGGRNSGALGAGTQGAASDLLDGAAGRLSASEAAAALNGPMVGDRPGGGGLRGHAEPREGAASAVPLLLREERFQAPRSALATGESLKSTIARGQTVTVLLTAPTVRLLTALIWRSDVEMRGAGVALFDEHNGPPLVWALSTAKYPGPVVSECSGERLAPRGAFARTPSILADPTFRAAPSSP